MATKILKCKECFSKNVTDINPTLRKTVKSISVEIEAKCDDCGHNFKYFTATVFRRGSGVLF